MRGNPDDVFLKTDDQAFLELVRGNKVDFIKYTFHRMTHSKERDRRFWLTMLRRTARLLIADVMKGRSK